jgi:O-antigen/teichoic acid export membrane protein
VPPIIGTSAWARRCTLCALAKYLLREDFGILTLAVAFKAIFSIFIHFGLGTLTTREVAETNH